MSENVYPNILPYGQIEEIRSRVRLSKWIDNIQERLVGNGSALLLIDANRLACARSNWKFATQVGSHGSFAEPGSNPFLLGMSNCLVGAI